jgi:hypothetical protein
MLMIVLAVVPPPENDPEFPWTVAWMLILSSFSTRTSSTMGILNRSAVPGPEPATNVSSTVVIMKSSVLGTVEPVHNDVTTITTMLHSPVADPSSTVETRIVTGKEMIVSLTSSIEATAGLMASEELNTGWVN